MKSMAIDVKGGKNVGIRDLRALHGVVENDLAMMGGLIVLEPLGDRKEQNFRARWHKREACGSGKRFDTPGAVGRRLKQPQLRLLDRKET